MRKKILHIFVTISFVVAGILFLQSSNPIFAQTKHTISGTVYLDTNKNGIQDKNEIIPSDIQVKISHNGKNSLIKIDSKGKYNFQTPDSGVFTVSMLFPNQSNSSDRYTKSVYLSDTTPKTITNFSVAENTSPPELSTQSTALQSSYPDCDFTQNVTCGNAYFCEDEGTSSRWCSYDNGQWCVDFIDYCTGGTCNSSTGQCGGGQTTSCDSIGDPCCGNICNGAGIVCTSLPANNGAPNSCQACGGPNQFCCSNAVCNNGYHCADPVSNPVCVQNVTYSISGYIYLDKDGNGQVTSGDSAFTQAPVTLTLQPGGGGSSISVSSNGGYYSQNVSTAGSYSIGLSAIPSGYRVTTQNPRSFLLNNSTPTQTVDFGLAPNDYKVSGVVYIDTNKNKVKDANEIGVGDETVSVSSGNGELNAQTNTSGQYTRTLPSQGLYSIRLLTKPQYENTSPEIQNFSITNTNNAPVFNFGIIPKATPSPSPTPATPVVKFLKPATDNLTVSGMMEIQATASVSGSTFTSFKICTDVVNDCIVADSATVTGRSVITVNVPGGADTTELTNGNHTLTATAVAANGKTGTATRTIKVQNNTPTPSKTPTPTTPGNTGTPNTNTPIPNSLTPRPTCGGENTGGSVIICITPPQSITPTPGACNNNNFCDFGENVNTCPAECQTRCGDNICSTPQENPFSCEADCGDPGTSATPTPTGTGATSTATPTRNPSHTATPTNPIGSTNTPTRNPSHTATPTRNPAHTATPTLPAGQTATPTPSLSPAPQDIILNVSVKFPGIGNKSGDVTNPVNKTIVAAVAVYNSSNQYVKQATGNLTFDGQVFKGPINIGSLPGGSYTTYIKTSNSLIKRLTPTITGGTGGPINIPQVELITGDFDQTNKLDIVDYNKLLTCYGKNQQGNILNIFGTNAFTCGLQDLNDDGKVDEKDVNIFLRGFAIREGDKP